MGHVLIPIFGIVMTMGIPIVAIIFYFLHRMQRTRAIRTALERGGELPPELLAALVGEAEGESKKKYSREYNIRTGMLAMAAGIGIAIPLYFVTGTGTAAWGLLPFLVGVALLIYGFARGEPNE
jgi:peptidoglycan/LPS O-acetylase OafA/YrhL